MHAASSSSRTSDDGVTDNADAPTSSANDGGLTLGIAAGEDPLLGRRLAFATGARIGLLTLVFTLTAVFYLRGDLLKYRISQQVIFGTILSGFAAAATYGVWLRSGRSLKGLALAQLAIDQVTWTAVVYVTGGPTSGATSFYALSALAGALTAGIRGAFVAASLGVALYGTLCLAFLRHWVLPPDDQPISSYATTFEPVAFSFLLNTLGILVVALLAGYLAERIRSTGGELVLAEERAVAAERFALLGRIAAGLAHEIRNPLGSIAGSVEMLRESSVLSDEDRALCDIVTRETSRLEQLVTDMMDLAKPRAPTVTHASIRPFLIDVVALAGRSPRAVSGDVVVRFRDTAPANDLRAWCDEAQMRQVAWNLVRNAIEVSAPKTEVHVVLSANEETVSIAVDDEGPGIDQTQIERIFDAFYTTRTQGAGIGLAVVKRIMDDHRANGASLRVRSRTSRGSRGSRFEVILKRVQTPGS